MSGWVGVDLDGTLAEYHVGAFDPYAVGKPIPAMVERVRRWLAEGREVRVFTARVDGGEAAHLARTESPEIVAYYRDVERVRALIQTWCVEHIGAALAVTNRKDYGMIELWDDRAVRVVMNTGERCCEVEDAR